MILTRKFGYLVPARMTARTNMENNTIIESWIDSSDKDFLTMNDMYKTKHYDWALFMGHLTIEKQMNGYPK